MTVTITPGHRDEELITIIKEARKSLTEEEWQSYCYSGMRKNERWLDALYYTAEDEGKSILAYWEGFLHRELTDGHKCRFISNLGGFGGGYYGRRLE